MFENTISSKVKKKTQNIPLYEFIPVQIYHMMHNMLKFKTVSKHKAQLKILFQQFQPINRNILQMFVDTII